MKTSFASLLIGQAKARDMLQDLEGVDSMGRPSKPTFMTNKTSSGGGASGDGGGASGGAGICYAFQKGDCSRGDSCRFSHISSGGGCGGGGNGGGNATGSSSSRGGGKQEIISSSNHANTAVTGTGEDATGGTGAKRKRKRKRHGGGKNDADDDDDVPLDGVTEPNKTATKKKK